MDLSGVSVRPSDARSEGHGDLDVDGLVQKAVWRLRRCSRVGH